MEFMTLCKRKLANLQFLPTGSAAMEKSIKYLILLNSIPMIIDNSKKDEKGKHLSFFKGTFENCLNEFM